MIPLSKLQFIDGLLNFSEVDKSTEDDHLSGHPTDDVKLVEDVTERD